LSKLRAKFTIEVDDTQEIEEEYKQQFIETYNNRMNQLNDDIIELMVNEAGVTKEAIKVNIQKYEIVD
jgi:hypothetical protein